MISAVTGPAVPGVKATGMARSVSTRGTVMRTLIASIDHPRPNRNGSAWTLLSPQSLKRPCVQRSAARIAGELGMRPPMRSVRYWAVSMISPWFMPASMIRAVRSGALEASAASAGTASKGQRGAGKNQTLHEIAPGDRTVLPVAERAYAEQDPASSMRPRPSSTAPRRPPTDAVSTGYCRWRQRFPAAPPWRHRRGNR